MIEPRLAARKLAALLVLVAILAAGACAFVLLPVRSDLAVCLLLGAALSAYLAVIARGSLRNVAVIGASLLVSVAAVEVYALRVSPAVIEIRTPGEQVPDPVLGWRPAHPGIFNAKKIDARSGRTIFDVDYTIDADLNRRVISAPSGPAIAFFGDSLTFGHGIPDDQTLPQLFADETGRKLRVLNLALAGSGPQQFLRALEAGTYDALLQRPRAFVYLTAPWHAQRTACADGHTRSPRYLLIDSVVTFAGACRDSWPVKLRKVYRNSAAYHLFLEPILDHPDANWVNLYVAVLVRAGQLAREKYGAQTLILYLPDPAYLHHCGCTDEQIVQRLRAGGLAVTVDVPIDPAEFPGQALAIPRDGHPTGVTNRARAKIILKALGSLASSSSGRSPESPP